ncbi:ABC transporter permease [Bradyrhizobium prioriisuperbiae]|uniref:ABC transporter permease n=1 Tax=Bradyrhizobium prioriisuperbiae TaxID=2854389 RepID=UPI0028EB7DC9|nr:ABC transporter permease subunit [Bradyrhizobium prioritasuperba]
MTSSAVTLPRPLPRSRQWLIDRVAPVLVVVGALLVIWYVAAMLMNATMVRDSFEREETPYGIADLIAGTLSGERPVLPAPHQIVASFVDSVVNYPPDSPRSLIYHSAVTLSATLLGFLLGSLFGIVLAVLIIHLRTLEKSLLPWIICSQMVPILAVAPIVIVVLGSIGIRGLLPKSIISAYLCFFPVAIGMVKGLTSPDPMQHDLMRTWSATRTETFWKLRWPSAVPFLFASLKVAITISLIGAIVGELPTGVQAGIGARLLAGSYYGQTVQMWAALLAASLLASNLVWLVSLTERRVARIMGVRT